MAVLTFLLMIVLSTVGAHRRANVEHDFPGEGECRTRIHRGGLHRTPGTEVWEETRAWCKTGEFGRKQPYERNRHDEL